MRVQKLIASVLLLGQLASAGQVDSSACQTLLSGSELQNELSRILKIQIAAAESGIDRTTLRLYRHSVEKKVRALCESTEGCTLETLTAAVQKETDQVFQNTNAARRRIRSLWGYTIIIAVLCGSAYGAHALKASLPHDWAWLAESLIPIAMSVGIVGFAKPLVDWYNNRTSTLNYRLKNGESLNGIFWRSEEINRLERMADSMRAHIDPDQQRVLSVLLSYLGTLRGIAKEAADLYFGNQHERAANRFAEMLIQHNHYLSFLPNGTDARDGEGVLRVVWMNFTDNIPDLNARKEFAKKVLAAIEKYDNHLNRDLPKDQEKILRSYRTVLEAWFKVSLSG